MGMTIREALAQQTRLQEVVRFLERVTDGNENAHDRAPTVIHPELKEILEARQEQLDRLSQAIASVQIAVE